MDELRFALIVAAAVVVAIAYLVIRHRERDGGRPISSSRLAPGIYLFTSATCVDCIEAHDQMTRRLGRKGFHEIAWESDAGAFDEFGVAVVPATMIVSRSGRARLFDGVPPRFAETGNP